MLAETEGKLRDIDLLSSRDRHFRRLTSLFDGETLEETFILNGYCGAGKSNPYDDPEAWVREALEDVAAHADLIRDPLVFRPLVVEYGPYGVHFVDRIFGARVYELDGSWQADYLDTPIGSLAPPELDRDETWMLAQRAGRAFLESGASLPLFGLPTIASAINIAVNLYGQEILLAMLSEPEAARADLGTINNALVEMHRRYLSTIPPAQLQSVIGAWRTQPAGYGQICGCSTQLLSPEIYRDFVAPLDDALLSAYPHGGMIHLCGAHTQHLPCWREMKSLRAVQLNDRAAEDLRIYFNALRTDQIIYVNPCETMPLERIMEITGGRRTVIVASS